MFANHCHKIASDALYWHLCSEGWTTATGTHWDTCQPTAGCSPCCDITDLWCLLTRTRETTDTTTTLAVCSWTCGIQTVYRSIPFCPWTWSRLPTRHEANLHLSQESMFGIQSGFGCSCDAACHSCRLHSCHGDKARECVAKRRHGWLALEWSRRGDWTAVHHWYQILRSRFH